MKNILTLVRKQDICALFVIGCVGILIFSFVC